MSKRTTHRSSKGTKLYAVRDKRGQFKDIQAYKRAQEANTTKRTSSTDELRESAERFSRAMKRLAKR
jgi:hypothetical protein